MRLSEGRDAIQEYVAKQTDQGLGHVLDLVTQDNIGIFALIGDLTEDEARQVTPVDEWSVVDAMRHMCVTVERSKDRLTALTAGREFAAPPGPPTGEYESFEEMRHVYIDGMAAVLALLRSADPQRGLDVISEHAVFGPFNWLGWAVFSHHVHTHDHIGQIENIRKALRA